MLGVNFCAVLNKLARFFFRAGFEGFCFAHALSGSVLPHIFRDFHGTKVQTGRMRAWSRPSENPPGDTRLIGKVGLAEFLFEIALLPPDDAPIQYQQHGDQENHPPYEVKS